MNQIQRDKTAGIVDRAAQWIALVGGTLTILVILIGLFSWAFGGLRLGSQVTNDNLTQKVDSIEGKVDKIEKKMADFPRKTDFDAQTTLNERFSTSIGVLENRETRTETRVDGLEAARSNLPLRQPSSSTSR